MNGIYLLRFTVDGVAYARRVVVDGEFYRFVDDGNKVLPGSPLYVAVALQSGSTFEAEPDWEAIVWHRVEDSLRSPFGQAIRKPVSGIGPTGLEDAS